MLCYVGRRLSDSEFAVIETETQRSYMKFDDRRMFREIAWRRVN